MQTALVTGASRGVGRGAAIGLAEAGFKVYATGRTASTADLPESVERLTCDHLHDDETAAAFARVEREAGGPDMLVNCAWGGYEKMVEDGRFTWTLPFWEQPAHRWASMMDAGVRAAYVASSHAARIMVRQRRGLIVNLSYWSARKHLGNVIYGIAKAATDKMAADMAHELRPYGVAAVSLYPGLVRTEAVMLAAEGGAFSLDNSESPEFIGRVVAAMGRTSPRWTRSTRGTQESARRRCHAGGPRAGQGLWEGCHQGPGAQKREADDSRCRSGGRQRRRNRPCRVAGGLGQTVAVNYVV